MEMGIEGCSSMVSQAETADDVNAVCHSLFALFGLASCKRLWTHLPEPIVQASLVVTKSRNFLC